MIQKMGYTGYFLIVWDFIRYAREQGIPVGPGRGSAAGSVVAWCLRITDVDPIEFDLIFERFLNPERVSMPDIDIDFCERRRGEVIEYVTRKYGRENVAQIITFGTMKAKAVVRDVGRVLDMTYAEVDKVAKLIPPALDMTLEKALVENPALKQLRDSDPKVKELLEIGQRLEGMTRHASVHAAGVVIAPSAITDYAPLYKGARDEIVTQWAMKEIERMGLLKMDFLGLSTLTLIDDALKEIKRTTGETLDIDAIPMDDPKTFALFADGLTAGVFQFESSGMREVLRKAKPSRFDDLIALNALYRPGPLGAGVVDSFVNRRHGREQITYMVPQMEPILSDTYGVIAYQEQVMRVARDVGGFTMGEADVLRKAMGKKDPKVMAAQRDRFVHGAIENKLSEKKAGEIFDLLAYFAGYGFNKSHSTTYALLAYQTGYLKANYPRYFMAALLTIEAQNTDKLSQYLGECRDLGVPVLPPDVNLSQLPFTVEPEGVRFGLTAVKNVGEGAIMSILGVRTERGGRIDSLRSLCEHADLRLVNKRVLESLAKAGALDSLAPPDEPITSRRARLCAAIDRALEHGNRIQKDRDRGQTQLFDAMFGGEDGSDDGAATASDLALPDAEPFAERPGARLRKGSAGALPERAPAGGAPGRPGQGRGTANRAVHRGCGRRARRRHHQWRPPGQDQEGRPHGGVHARGPRCLARGGGLPRDVPQLRPRDRERPHGPGAGQARGWRGHREDPGKRDQAALLAQRDPLPRGRDLAEDAVADDVRGRGRGAAAPPRRSPRASRRRDSRPAAADARPRRTGDGPGASVRTTGGRPRASVRGRCRQTAVT